MNYDMGSIQMGREENCCLSVKSLVSYSMVLLPRHPFLGGLKLTLVPSYK